MKKTAEAYEHGNYLFELELEDDIWNVNIFNNKKQDTFLADKFIESSTGLKSLNDAILWCKNYSNELDEINLQEIILDIKNSDIRTGYQAFNLLLGVSEKVLDLEQQLKEVKDELEN